MTKRIVLDATPFLFPLSGVMRMMQTLFSEICALPNPYEFILYSRSFRKRPTAQVSQGHRHIHFPWPQMGDRLIKALGLIEKMTKADLYHVTDHYMPVKDLRKTVVTLHDVMFLMGMEKDDPRLSYFNKVVPPLVRGCLGVMTCSEFIKRDIVRELQIDPAKITVIPFGVDTESFYPASNSSREKFSQQFKFTHPYFLAVGCFAPRKNAARLLEAFELFLKKKPKHQLVIVGSFPAELKLRYKHLSDQGLLHLVGVIDDNQLCLLYQQATALIFPSLYEGFGCPLLEAMACGTPIICSNVSSLPEVGGDVPYFIDPHDVPMMAKALEKFENGDLPVDMLRQKGFERVRNFTWEKSAKKTLAAYGEYLEKI